MVKRKLDTNVDKKTNSSAGFMLWCCRRSLIWLMLLLLPLTAQAEWLTVKDDEVTVYFNQRNEKQARHILAIYRQYMPLREAEFDHKVKEFNLLVLDITDFPNGYSTFFPRNLNGIFLVPPTEGTLVDEAGWLDTVVNHESVHLYHLDKAEGTPQDLQSYFGRNLLLFPAVFNPTWLLEGLATFMETDQTRRIGRGATGYFDAIMRLEYTRGFRSLHDTSYNSFGYPRGVSYYYGYYFFEYLYSKAGSQAIFDLVEDYSGNLIPYMLSSTFKDTLGVNLGWLWDGYRDYLSEKFSEQLQTIKAQGVREGARVSLVNSVEPRASFAPDGSMYYLWRHPYTGIFQIRQRPADIAPTQQPTADQDDELQKLFEQEIIVASEVFIGDFAIHPEGGLVYSALAVCDLPDDWMEAFYFDLYLIAAEGSKPKKIASCERYSKVRWHPNGRAVFGLRHVGGQSQINLLRLNVTGNKEVEEVYKATQQGETLGSFSVSRDAQRLAISRYLPAAGWDMYLFDLSDKTFRKLTNKGNIEIAPIFGDDDKTISYASNRGGVYNIRQLDLQSGKITTITNTTSAAFSPTLAPSGKLYFSRLYSEGFAVHQVALEAGEPVSLIYHNPVKQQRTAASDYSLPTATAQPYSLFSGMAPTYWLPLLYSYNEVNTVGLLTGGADILNNQQWSLRAVAGKAGSVNNYEYQASYLFRNWLGMNISQIDKIVHSKSRDNKNSLQLTQTRYTASAQRHFYATAKSRLSGFAGLVGDQRKYQKHGNPDVTRKDVDDTTISGIGVNWSSGSKGVKAAVPSLLLVRLIQEQIYDKSQSVQTSSRYLAHLNQYIHIYSGHFLSYTLINGEAQQDNGAFSFGLARSGTENLSLLPNIGTARLPLLGYAQGDSELIAKSFVFTELAWELPGGMEGIGFTAPPVGVDGYHFRLLAQNLYLQRPVYASYRAKNFASIAAEMRFKAVFGYVLLVPLKIVIANGLSKNGQQVFGIMTDYTF